MTERIVGTDGSPSERPQSDADQLLVERLRQGDESAFASLVEQYHPAMVRLALGFVANRAAAEDVVQEAWVGVLRGLARFEGRSSLKTWLFRIVTNRAKTRAVRDGRVVPFTDLWRLDDESDEPSVPLDRFSADQHDEHGHWVSAPQSWEDLPEERLLSQELQGVVQAAIDQLPASQKAVITLRDLEGWGSEEVCNTLEISESNQRVLLHRARSKVRRALEAYLGQEQARA
jgi:RNA polymerase sigma-70 factor, ECF subfamily